MSMQVSMTSLLKDCVLLLYVVPWISPLTPAIRLIQEAFLIAMFEYNKSATLLQALYNIIGKEIPMNDVSIGTCTSLVHAAAFRMYNTPEEFLTFQSFQLVAKFANVAFPASYEQLRTNKSRRFYRTAEFVRSIQTFPMLPDADLHLLSSLFGVFEWEEAIDRHEIDKLLREVVLLEMQILSDNEEKYDRFSVGVIVRFLRDFAP